MAHPSFHLFSGLTVGTIALAPQLIKAWKKGGPVANRTAAWLAASWGLGFYASIPNILSLTSLPNWVITGWWMNMFLFHPLLDRLEPQGMLTGQVGVTALFALQYGVLLMAIHRAAAIRKEDRQ